MIDWSGISTAISTATGQPFQYASHYSIGGGCINQALGLCGKDGREFFLKLNVADTLEMFVAESVGLQAMSATLSVRVPRPIVSGVSGAHAFLVLEYLTLSSRGNAAQLGKQLAAMHRCTEEQFGFAQDNYLGTTPQPNGWTADWISFWRERRLGYQLELAARSGYPLHTLGAQLLDTLPAFFEGYAPQPSLLHGDLWSGNHGYLADGTPLIFDPAAYYGDRECDLAMTELFGGYPAEFYAAYQADYPLDAGYAVRKDLYNLYHILNHANLFGGSYVRQAKEMARRLLAGVM